MAFTDHPALPRAGISSARSRGSMWDLAAYPTGGAEDSEVMSASTASRDFVVIFSVPSRTVLMAALRISQSRLPIICVGAPVQVAVELGQ